MMSGPATASQQYQSINSLTGAAIDDAQGESHFNKLRHKCTTLKLSLIVVFGVCVYIALIPYENVPGNLLGSEITSPTGGNGYFIVLDKVTKRRTKSAQKIALKSQEFLSSSLKKSKKSKHSKVEPSATTSQPQECDATVIVIRHCEKDTERSHCNHVGYERSQYLATLFGHGDERWPAPHHIFAMSQKRGGHKNFREIETVAPVADKLGIRVETFDQGTSEDLAKLIFSKLQDGSYCDRLILVSWKHSDIPNLAQRLGCGPIQGCPLDYPKFGFDLAWEVRFMKKKGSMKWGVYGSIQSEGFDPLRFRKYIQKIENVPADDKSV